MAKVMPTRSWRDNSSTVIKNLMTHISTKVVPDQAKLEKMYDEITLILKYEVQQVILDYNAGKLERFSGDYAKRVADNLAFGRNMPLVLSWDLINSLEHERKYLAKKVVLTVFTDIIYAGLLEEGTDRIQAFMYMEIALQRAEQKILNYVISQF